MYERTVILLRSILFVTSLSSIIVSLWLLSVLLFVLPRVNPATVPFWAIVMIGFFAFGAASLYVARYSIVPRAIGIGLGFVSGVAILLGTSAVLQNELRDRRTGTWEGYVSLMGLILVAHGCSLLVYLIRTRKRPTGTP